MAEKLCTLRTKGGGGGKYTETSLWTNQSPTSSFTSQTVTLSESMDNFKYLKIKYAFSTSLYADANCNEIVISVADFKKSLSAASGNALIVVGGSSSTTRYTRFVFYPSNTGVQFGHSVQFQTSTTNNNACIPLEILGLNELDHGTVATIPEVRFSSVNTSGRCFGYIYLDLSKYKSMTYTLVISNASFGSGQYIRVDNNGTAVQEMGKTAGTYTINFDDSWTGDNYRLAVIATPSAAYGYIGITNIIFTLKDN